MVCCSVHLSSGDLLFFLLHFRSMLLLIILCCF